MRDDMENMNVVPVNPQCLRKPPIYILPTEGSPSFAGASNWIPAIREVSLAERRIAAYLMINGLDSLLSEYERYRVQCAGHIINGEKVLLFNYVKGDFSDETLRTEFISTDPSGGSFFSVKVKGRVCYDLFFSGKG
jgi:hypothetical protein